MPTFDVAVRSKQLGVSFLDQDWPHLADAFFVGTDLNEGVLFTAIHEDLVVNCHHNRPSRLVEHYVVHTVLLIDARLLMEYLLNQLGTVVRDNAHRRQQVAVSKRTLFDIDSVHSVGEDLTLAIV